MGANIAQELASVRDATSCRDWLATLDLPLAQRAELIEQLLDSLEHGVTPAEPTFDILEQLRVPYLRALDARLRELADNPFPLPATAWVQLHSNLESLRRLRDLLLRIDSEVEVTVIDAPSGPMRRVRERATQTLQSAMPLMRALDLQCRLLHALLLFQVRIDAAEWTVLADLAAQARATTFMDAPLPDEFPIVRGASARSLFVSALLLRIARMDAHDAFERALIDRMARHWAGRVGFRIDEGAQLHSNRHGPTIVLDQTLAVRLDTQSLLRKLDERHTLLNDGTGIVRGLPRGMGRRKAVHLLDGLRVSWSASARPTAHGMPVNCPAAMHIGLPNFSAALDAMAYDYGRYEHDTLIRQAPKLRRDTPDLLAQLHAQLLDGAETVDWLARLVDEARLERILGSPLVHGALIVLRARPTRPPMPVALTDPAALWLGQVIAMEQSAQPDRAGRRAQRVSVQLWRRPALLGALRLNQSALFEPVYFLPASNERGASVFLPPGCWRPRTDAQLRLPSRELTVTLERAIDQGPGFERVLLSGVDTL